MAYRKTTRYTKQLATMREAKARKRLADPVSDHPTVWLTRSAD